MVTPAGSGGGGGTEAAAETDRKLVQRTLAGDREAFAVLHRRYYGRVYRLALIRCRNVSDAEDVAAETFVRAITHLPGYRFQGESLFPWLARIAANLIADQGRRRGMASFVSLDSGGADDDVRALIEGISDRGAPDPHVLAERRETQALLRAAVAALPADQAEAVTLRFVGELSLKEIAGALHRSEGAVKSLLHRALVGLRRSLTGNEAAAAVFGRAATTNAAAATTVAAGETLAGWRSGGGAHGTSGSGGVNGGASAKRSWET